MSTHNIILVVNNMLVNVLRAGEVAQPEVVGTRETPPKTHIHTHT